MLKRRVARLYDASSRVYDRLYLDEQRRKHVVALSMARPSEAVADVGCGTGLLLRDLSRLCGLAIGVDLSRGMIRRAYRRVGRLAELVRGDAEALPFKDEALTEVYMVTVLQNLSRPMRGLEEAFRVLRRGGRLVVTVPRKLELASSLRGMVEEAGFKVLDELGGEGLADVVVLCVKPPYGVGT